jgi:acyl-CoA dehydrogenase
MPSNLEKVAGFAAGEVARRAEALNSGAGFPIDIWAKMGEEGLLSLNLPGALGGMEYDPLRTTAALEAFVRNAKNIGLAFSWLVHLILSRWCIMELGTAEQKAAHLPALASGKSTVSFAISEPGAGARPKHLKTSAVPEPDGSFTLDGEKNFLTNGPVADLFLVLAVTSMREARKGFSAFLVEKNTPGLSFTPQFDIGCLYPSPHCGMKLEGCRVPASSLLGEKDSAYERIAKPFRMLEDVFMTGLVLGGMELQLDLLLNLLREKGPPHSMDVKLGLGELRTLTESFRVLVREIGRLAGENGLESPQLLCLVLSFRHWSNHYQSRFEEFRSRVDAEDGPILRAVTRDLTRIAGIAKSIVSLKKAKIGESLLPGKGPDAESGYRKV